MKIVLATVALALGLVALPATATTISECQGLIAMTKGDLAGVEIGGGNPDRTRASLESKLDGASVKLDQLKLEDAQMKLTDFQTSVANLVDVPKPKISAEDAAILTGDAGAAFDCVQNLIDGF